MTYYLLKLAQLGTALCFWVVLISAATSTTHVAAEPPYQEKPAGYDLGNGYALVTETQQQQTWRTLYLRITKQVLKTPMVVAVQIVEDGIAVPTKKGTDDFHEIWELKIERRGALRTTICEIRIPRVNQVSIVFSCS